MAAMLAGAVTMVEVMGALVMEVAGCRSASRPHMPGGKIGREAQSVQGYRPAGNLDDSWRPPSQCCARASACEI